MHKYNILYTSQSKSQTASFESQILLHNQVLLNIDTVEYCCTVKYSIQLFLWVNPERKSDQHVKIQTTSLNTSYSQLHRFPLLFDSIQPRAFFSFFFSFMIAFNFLTKYLVALGELCLLRIRGQAPTKPTRQRHLYGSRHLWCSTIYALISLLLPLLSSSWKCC